MSSAQAIDGEVVGYHWSPSTRREGIEARGLVIGSAPAVNSAQGHDHRNGWVSVSPTALQAWWLSAGALAAGGFQAPESPLWLLWEVDITSLEAINAVGQYREWRVLQDIAPERVKLVGQRVFGVAV